MICSWFSWVSTVCFNYYELICSSIILTLCYKPGNRCFKKNNTMTESAQSPLMFINPRLPTLQTVLKRKFTEFEIPEFEHLVQGRDQIFPNLRKFLPVTEKFSPIVFPYVPLSLQAFFFLGESRGATGNKFEFRNIQREQLTLPASVGRIGALYLPQ